MADEVEFINTRGEKTYLPESVGQSMGLQRASDFVPPESRPKDLLDFLKGAKVPEEVLNGTVDSVDYVRSLRDGAYQPSKPTFGQAVSLLREFMDTATDTEKQPERMDELADLGTDLLRYTGHLETVTGQQAQTGGPSLVDSIRQIELQLDADKTKTPKQKETIKKHLQDLLTADAETETPAPPATPPADAPPVA